MRAEEGMLENPWDDRGGATVGGESGGRQWGGLLG